MSIFVPIPNNKMRVRCTICNNEVSKALEHRHQQYHVLGEMALSKTETACPLCLTPVSIKVHNYVKHLEGFHRIPHQRALEMNNQAKLEAGNRNNELPKPTFKVPKNVQNQIEQKAEERQMRVDENRINIPRANPDAILPRGRPRKIPNLQGESDIERERRLNRNAVNKFRAKVREQRGLPAPKAYNRTLLEGETQEERERRLNRERVKKYRQAQKAKKANQ